MRKFKRRSKRSMRHKQSSSENELRQTATGRHLKRRAACSSRSTADKRQDAFRHRMARNPPKARWRQYVLLSLLDLQGPSRAVLFGATIG